MTNYANMPNVKPPQFSLDGEMERLRVEIRDRDFIIIRQQTQIASMRNCENCNNFQPMPDGSFECFSHAPCALPALDAWEPQQ